MRITDLEGKVLNGNNAYCTLTGFDIESLIGKSFEIVYNEKEQSDILKYYKDFISRDKIHERNLKELKFRNGKLCCLDSSYSLIEITGEKYVLCIFRDITGRKHSEEKTLLLAHTIKSISEIITITDLEDKITFVNQAFIEKYGYSYEEIIGQHINILLSPNNPTEILKDILENSRKDNWKGELLDITKDGKEFPISLQTSKILNDNGDILGLVGIAEDITERKQIENILKKSEQNYHSIFEATGTATMIIEENTIISMVNNECLKLTGYNPGELIGTKWTNYIAPECLKEMLKYHNLRRENPEKTPDKYEVKLLHKNGEVRIAILDIGMIPDTKQSIVSILDITEWKKSDEELKKSEERFKQVSENAREWIWEVDKNGLYTYASHVVENMLGYEPEEIINKKYFYEFFAPNIREQMKQAVFEAFAKKEIFRDFLNCNLHKDGREIILSTSGVPILDSEGNLSGYRGVDIDITKQKLAEAELQKSEEKYRTLIENMGEGIAITDEEEKFIFVNSAAEEIFNAGKGELSGLGLEKFVSDENYNIIKNQTKERASGKSSTYELELNLSDGSKKIIYVIATPWYVNNKFKGTLGIFQDITERKQTEEALQKSEEKYRTLIENMGEGITITDEEEKFIFVNPAAEKIFGVMQGELEREGINLFFPGEKFNEVKKRTNERRKGKTSSFEEEIILKDGSKKDILVTASPWYIDNKFKGTFAIFRDITKRKKAEELLKTSEEKYRNLIETMPEGFYRSTPEGYFLDVNPAFVKMLGYESKEELMKVNIPEELYFSRDERTDDVKYNIDFIQDTEVYRLKKKDGSEIRVEDNSRYIKDSSGKVLFHEGIMRDVTESLRARKAILEAKEKAEEASRLKSSFLANMSHEIRTPLNGILGFAEILKNELKDKSLINYAEVIEKSGNRLLETLDLILSFSKLEAEKEDAHYSNVLLENVIDEVLESFEAVANNKKLYLRTVIKEKRLITKIDERFLRQIMNNLINNAIKYTNSGGVTVGLSKEEKEVVISVRDTGIGISGDKHEIIFEEFRQESEGYGRSFEGTGLGLAITRQFVELMKGTIEVDSEVGVGSTFTVKFPFETVPQTITIKKENKQPIKQIYTNSKNKKFSVLLVENDSMNLDYTIAILNNEYDIESAADGFEAIDKAKEKVHDIILMDINLGKGMDGIETVRKIRKLPGYAEIPVVAVTAFVLPGDKEEFIAGGCNYYLGKPFTRNQILELLNNIICKD